MLDHEAIARLRKAKGLSQSQAAKAAGGWFVQQWNRLEMGEVPSPRLDTLESLAAVLGCSIADLVKDGKPKRKRGVSRAARIPS